MNKKTGALAMALACMLLAGCTGGTQSSSTSSEPPPTEAELLQQRIDENKELSDDDFDLVQFEDPTAGETIAVVETSKGTIKIRLFPNEAPQAVEAFTELAKAGAYDDKLFSEISANYMLESASVTGKAAFENEYSLNLWHFRGAVGLVSALDGKTATGGQFYIIQNNGIMADVLEEMERVGFPTSVWEKYNRHGGAPWMDGKSTVFGHVIEGMTVVDDIVLEAMEAAEEASQASSASSGAAKQPPVEVKIVKVTLETYPAAEQSSSTDASATDAKK